MHLSRLKLNLKIIYAELQISYEHFKKAYFVMNYFNLKDIDI
jgi:hypothetical protein